VQVVHQLDFGTTEEPHRGFESNEVAFMLAPQITTPLPTSVAAGGTLTLSFVAPVGRTQRVALLIGDRAIEIPPRDPAGPDTASSLDFEIPPDWSIGTFLLRVRVDGAESFLTVDTDPASPTFNQYVGPQVTIT
jgi:hypothetical protein